MSDISKAAAAMGLAGRGESKRRGDRAHYVALVGKRKDRACVYCDARPAISTDIYEPTDRGTYTPATRIVCSSCAEAYGRVPFGFVVD